MIYSENLGKGVRQLGQQSMEKMYDCMHAPVWPDPPITDTVDSCCLDYVQVMGPGSSLCWGTLESIGDFWTSQNTPSVDELRNITFLVLHIASILINKVVNAMRLWLYTKKYNTKTYHILIILLAN